MNMSSRWWFLKVIYFMVLESWVVTVGVVMALHGG
jgi:hypothetical protein